MDDVEYYLGLHPLGALAVVVSTALLYAAFAGILRRYGQRLYASPSSMHLAIVTVLGAIVGRAILGRVPTLGGALLALATLFVLEGIAGRVRRGLSASGVGQRRAEVLMVNGRPEVATMRRLRLDEDTVYAAVRGAGLRTPHDAALVVLERNGRFSVIRGGAPIDPATLTGVRDAAAVGERLRSAGL